MGHAFIFLFVSIWVHAAESSSVIWQNANVTDVQVSSVKPSTSTDYQIPLTVVIDRGSTWTTTAVEEFVRASELIFAQCQLSYSSISVVQLRHPDLADFTPRTDYLITRDFPASPLARPMVIFNSGSYGSVYANAAYYKDHEYEVFNEWTAFIDSLALAIHSNDKELAYFVKTVVAHELLHTLLNIPHNDEPGSILSNVQKGERINPEQCAGLQNHILTRHTLH